MPRLEADSIIERTVEQLYWTLELRADGIVRLARRNVAYPSLTAVHESYDDFLKVVDDWLLERRIKAGRLGTKRRTKMGWLTDMREGPELRNDPEFEAVVRERRPELLQRSPALGVLVRTTAGRMQLGRITRQKDHALGVFNDEVEAVSWLYARMEEYFPRE